jgi:cytochrome c-type biogenesis protein CcmF
MIIELGHFALVLALFIALLQAGLTLAGAAKNHWGLMMAGRLAAAALFPLVGFAFATLVHAYLISDFSVAVVAAHSHSDTPWLYKLTGVWGNHEGSMVLWVLILSLYGAAVSWFGDAMPPRLCARVIGVMGLIGVGFLLFILLTSNPFLRLDPAPANGQGLNPILQDPGLAFHPPFLYLGYVGTAVSFSFAVAALIEGRVDAAWARWVRPWTLASWCCLTLGISMGSWWAYYTLGWGGWWFWDPVENASLMPWLASTALIHSAIVVERRDTLKSWAVLLAILTFSLSLVGTFLVRSGVLTSVHAFALDPKRGVFILLLLLIAIGGALALYAWRAPRLEPGGVFAPVSRAILAWKRGDMLGALQRQWVEAAVAIAAMLAAFTLTSGGPMLAVLGLASWIGMGVLVELAERLRLFRAPWRETWRRALNQPRASYGMNLAHFGLAVTVAGIAGIAFESGSTALIHLGEQIPLANYSLRFDGIGRHEGENYTADAAEFTLLKGGRVVAEMTPERRFFPLQQQSVAKPAIHTNLVSDFYLALGDPDGQGGWTITAAWRPLVPFIWIGGVFMAIGGAVSLSDRRWADWAARFGTAAAGSPLPLSPAEKKRLADILKEGAG